MTYEYVCTSCQHAWEEEQRISEAPLTTCPQCHLETAKRQVSGGAGFILKGGGWYADLYSSSKGGASAKDNGSSSTKDNSTSTKSGDSSSSSSSTSTASSSSSDSSSSSGSKPAGATAT
jgi:putative FmdB family regulatory protein